MRRDLPGLGRIKKKKGVYAEQVKMQLQERKSLAGIETRLGAVKLSIPMTEHRPDWAYAVIQEDGSRKLTQAAGQRAAQADENRSEILGFVGYETQDGYRSYNTKLVLEIDPRSFSHCYKW